MEPLCHHDIMGVTPLHDFFSDHNVVEIGNNPDVVGEDPRNAQLRSISQHTHSLLVVVARGGIRVLIIPRGHEESEHVRWHTMSERSPRT